MSIYEDVSKIIANDSCEECFTKYDIGSVISRKQKSVIDNIIRELRNGERESNIEHEIQEILSADPSNGKVQKGVEFGLELSWMEIIEDAIDELYKSKTSN